MARRWLLLLLLLRCDAQESDLLAEALHQPLKPKNDVGMGSKLGIHSMHPSFWIPPGRVTLCSFANVECQVARLKAEVERLKAGLGWQLG